MDRVIFRTEKDPYISETRFVAVFPDYSKRPGYITCLSFYFSYNDMDRGTVWFEPWGEMSETYYAKTKLVRKNSVEAKKCLAAVLQYINRHQFEPETELRIVERRNPYGRRRCRA